MVAYTVSIEPAEGRGAGLVKAVLRIDTGSSDAHITDMALTSTAEKGLRIEDVSLVDWREVLSALGKSVQDRPQRVPATANRPLPDQTGNDAPIKGRAYRRKPDSDELRDVFEQTQTVTGVARHYGVPRHTAQGWVSRLRKADALGDAP